jgi:hypothetical protein
VTAVRIIRRALQIWLSAQLGGFAGQQFHFIAYNSWRYIISSWISHPGHWLAELFDPRMVEFDLISLTYTECVPCIAAAFFVAITGCKLALMGRRWTLLLPLVFALFFAIRLWWFQSWYVGERWPFTHFFD